MECHGRLMECTNWYYAMAMAVRRSPIFEHGRILGHFRGARAILGRCGRADVTPDGSPEAGLDESPVGHD